MAAWGSPGSEMSLCMDARSRCSCRLSNGGQRPIYLPEYRSAGRRTRGAQPIRSVRFADALSGSSALGLNAHCTLHKHRSQIRDPSRLSQTDSHASASARRPVVPQWDGSDGTGGESWRCTTHGMPTRNASQRFATLEGRTRPKNGRLKPQQPAESADTLAPEPVQLPQRQEARCSHLSPPVRDRLAAGDRRRSRATSAQCILADILGRCSTAYATALETREYLLIQESPTPQTIDFRWKDDNYYYRESHMSTAIYKTPP